MRGVTAKVWAGLLAVSLATGCAALQAAGRRSREPVAFRVATFNIRLPADKTPNAWPERAPRCLALIRRHGFDLMGLQEATAGQIDDLLAEGWAYVGAGRDDGKRGGEASCIFYRTARFEVSASGTFWLSETPEVVASKSWNTACTRVCTWARMRDLASGREFALFNTHLDHMSAQARENGMALIVARIASLGRGLPVILTGDMNATPGSEPIRRALAVLRDAAAVSRAPHQGPAATFNGFNVDKTPTARIDYIFVSDGVEVLTHATLDDRENGLYPSDHFPVMADVALK